MSLYTCHRYIMMTTDPVHIGTGGYRLGRVDNSIMREPGTRLPKIPGTSLHGAARTYSARLYGDLAAAGATHNTEPATNPICYTYGYIASASQPNGKSTARGYSGVVSITDARLLLFPVASGQGPLWITTRQLLDEAGFVLDGDEAEGEPDKQECWYIGGNTERLNLGWLMLPVKKQELKITPPSEIEGEQRWKAISNKIVVVHAALFAAIVNSNLEVRTSVSIDPERGAADDGKLFTYEALPRAAFLSFDVIVDDYRGSFPDTTTRDPAKPIPGYPHGWDTPLAVVNAGLRLIEWLGIGGMGTRGFGRAAMLASWEVTERAEVTHP